MDEKKRPDRLAHKSCAPCVSAAGASVAGSPGGVWGADAQDGPERAVVRLFLGSTVHRSGLFLWAFFLKKARRHPLAAVGGLLVLTVCALPPVLKAVSYSLYSAFYGQLQTAILLYGLIFTLYILLLIDCSVKRGA